MANATFQSDNLCKKCGSRERYRESKNCAPCARRQAKEYRIANPEYCQAAARDRYMNRKLFPKAKKHE